MVGGIHLKALLEVSANVDDLCAAALREEGPYDVDATRLSVGHDDVADEDVDLLFCSKDGLERGESGERDDAVGKGAREQELDLSTEVRGALWVVIEDDDRDHGHSFDLG